MMIGIRGIGAALILFCRTGVGGFVLLFVQ